MRENNTIVINGKTYSPENIRYWADEPFQKELCDFLMEWFDESDTIEVQTSGSTGIPKCMRVSKQRMIQSARMTCDFLHLQPSDTALLCMPLQYIAGKMVVVRAIVGQLNLIVRTPLAFPMEDVDIPLHFAAMTPMQVYNSLQTPAGRERINRIDNLIIGGGAIDKRLEEDIRPLTNATFSTYGMTETLSHIAMRRLNGDEASGLYTPLPGVVVSIADDGTLLIDAPLVASSQLKTNDIAGLTPDGRFFIKGRKDNVINSGGIKIQAEEVEAVLQQHTIHCIAATSVPHVGYGEALVLLVEKEIEPSLNRAIAELIHKYYRPKHLITIDTIPQTPNGKIDRQTLRQLAIRLTVG